ncbi:hypothetical protein PGT21_021332 [Puccinia graminis f. sp. tritici]|uniref:Uncharacterized protein n=1 Tax=Puccinia graminis f. sp. tritici TaxID=56615 RepID=A0A5B0PQJ1_PUCGR|nr:hypothetical protein PGT21_021332 [Puccinia graminis f. sp. tritici]
MELMSRQLSSPLSLANTAGRRTLAMYPLIYKTKLVNLVHDRAVGLGPLRRPHLTLPTSGCSPTSHKEIFIGYWRQDPLQRASPISNKIPGAERLS